MKLIRCSDQPVLSPLPGSPWESLVTTNPSAWYDAGTGEVSLLYRAAGHDPEHKVWFGLAKSRDGVNFTRCSAEPVFGPSADGFDAGCVEDPRIMKIDDWFYVTYASRPYPPGEYWKPEAEQGYRRPATGADFPWIMRRNATATGLALTQDFKSWIRAGRLTNPTVDDRDVMLFPEKIGGRYAMIHRPMNWHGEGYPCARPSMWISYSDDILHWTDSKLLAQGIGDGWEAGKIGGNTTPIKTPDGWLTLYHAVGPDKFYRVGALLLDLEDPSIVRYRTRDWILQPELPWEIDGYYKGVVFPCGKVVIDGRLFVYYGGADKYVGVAACPLDELLAYMRECPVA